MSAIIHPAALCETAAVGDGTRIGAFAHVLAGATIGRDCHIGDHVFIESGVVIGARVTIKGGVELWNGLRVEDDVFIGPGTTFINDRFPRSGQDREPVKTQISRGASIGGNCTIAPGVSIGRDAMIEPGAVVTQDVPARAVVAGNPARIVGYADTVQTASSVAERTTGLTSLSTGASVCRFPVHADLRGSLTVGNFSEHVPFVPKRFFFVYDVPGRDVRGEHAHRVCKQMLMCPYGSVSILTDNGKVREEVLLDNPSIGLFIPPMVWSVQYRHSPGAVLAVFASELYDAADYIRDYEEFLRLSA